MLYVEHNRLCLVFDSEYAVRKRYKRASAADWRLALYNYLVGNYKNKYNIHIKKTKTRINYQIKYIGDNSPMLASCVLYSEVDNAALEFLEDVTATYTINDIIKENGRYIVKIVMKEEVPHNIEECCICYETNCVGQKERFACEHNDTCNACFEKMLNPISCPLCRADVR